MGLKPTLPRQESLPIDDLIGTAYDNVKLVADNLEMLNLIAGNIAQANIGIIQDLDALELQFDALRLELLANTSQAESTLSQIVNAYTVLTTNNYNSVTGDYAALNSSVLAIIGDLATILGRLDVTDGLVIDSVSRIVSLETDVVTIANGQTVQGTAIDALDSRIVVAEAGITVTSTKLTELESEIDGEIAARTTAVNLLNASVTETENSIASIASDIVLLNTKVTDNIAGLAAQGIAVSSLTSRTTIAEGNIASVSQSVTALTNTVTSNTNSISATNSAVATLSNEVGAVEGLAYAHSQDIVDLNVVVTSLDTDSLLAGQAISELNLFASSTATGMDILAQDVVRLDGRIDSIDVSGQAQAYDELAARVTVNEGDITAVSSDISTLNTNATTQDGLISGNSNAIGTLNSSVSVVDGKVTAQANQLTQLRSAINQSVILAFDANHPYVLGDMFTTATADPTPVFTYYEVILVQNVFPQAAPPNATYYTEQVGFEPMQATLDIHAGTLATLESQTARWEVKTNVNDLVSKVGFYNDGINTKFVIGQGNAENFSYDIVNNKLTIAGKITLTEPSSGFGQFTDVPDYALASEITNFVTATTLDQDLALIQSQIDGNIASWFFDNAPSLTNAPANTWTDDTVKDAHLGDLYYDKLTKYAYRFMKDAGVYSWDRLLDTDVSLALENASKAQDTADGKRRVFVTATLPVPPYDEGDLWAYGGVIKVSDTSIALGGTALTGHWVTQANVVTDVNQLNDADSILVQTALEWGNLGSIPPRFLDTADIGLNLTPTHLGYNTDGSPSGWKTYMDSSGNFYLNNGSPTNSLAWNGTTLVVRGAIEISGGSTGYTNIADKPTTLAEISSTESSKLAGIAVGATDGAPAGSAINGVPVETITATLNDFNTSNNRNSAVIVNPTILTNGAAISHVYQDNGTVDIRFEWIWNGVSQNDIDGFIVYVRSSTSATAYTFSTSPSQETAYNVPADKRAITLYGLVPTDYFTFGVQAYRRVDGDIDPSGLKLSLVVKATGTGENPYRPESSIAFAGNVIGTIDNMPVAQVNDWAYINTPGVLDTPVAPNVGLYVGAANLGFYDNGVWKTYMDNVGNFYLGGTSGKLQWNAVTNTLSINGHITMSNQSTINIAGFQNSTDYENIGITINPDGTLSGAGTGQVDIVQLGYSGELDATRGATWNSDILGQPSELQVLNNLVDSTMWEDGQTGSVGDYTVLSAATDQSRVVAIGPHGHDEVVWRTVNQGGFLAPLIGVDNKKSYRLSIWVKRVSTSGSIRLRIETPVTNIQTNATSSWAGAPTGISPPVGVWCLFTTIVHSSLTTLNAYNYNSTYYSKETGARVSATNFAEYKFQPSTHTLIMGVDCSSGNVNNEVLYTRPRIDVIDGNEATKEELLGTLSHLSPDVSTGLNLTANHLGYHNGSAWQSYMDNQGRFYLNGDASNYLYWDGASLQIKGNIEATSIAAETTLSAPVITGGTIDGVEISGTTITGGTVQTNVNTLERVELSSYFNALLGYWDDGDGIVKARVKVGRSGLSGIDYGMIMGTNGYQGSGIYIRSELSTQREYGVNVDIRSINGIGVEGEAAIGVNAQGNARMDGTGYQNLGIGCRATVFGDGLAFNAMAGAYGNFKGAQLCLIPQSAAVLTGDTQGKVVKVTGIADDIDDSYLFYVTPTTVYSDPGHLGIVSSVFRLTLEETSEIFKPFTLPANASTTYYGCIVYTAGVVKARLSVSNGNIGVGSMVTSEASTGNLNNANTYGTHCIGRNLLTVTVSGLHPILMGSA